VLAMTSNFDKFTERSRRALSLAKQEAIRLNHSYIGTEHLLLGIVLEEQGIAARVLRSMGVELSEIRSAVEFIVGRGEVPHLGELLLTSRAKRAIQFAVDEADRIGDTYIGTEHLLLGLLREGEGIGPGLLESLGVELAKVRTTTLTARKAGREPSGTELQSSVEGGDQPAKPAVRNNSDERDVALLQVALRLARMREDQPAINKIRVALESAELRRLVGLRMAAREKLIEAEQQHIGLLTRMRNLERELEDYDRQINRIRVEFAHRSDDDPPDAGVGART
jgi:hypothetical protein